MCGRAECGAPPGGRCPDPSLLRSGLDFPSPLLWPENTSTYPLSTPLPGGLRPEFLEVSPSCRATPWWRVQERRLKPWKASDPPASGNPGLGLTPAFPIQVPGLAKVPPLARCQPSVSPSSWIPTFLPH